MSDRVHRFSIDDPSDLDQIEAFIGLAFDDYVCPTCGGGVIVTRTPNSFSAVHDCSPTCTQGESNGS